MLEEINYNFHSLRIGRASFLQTLGLPDENVKKNGKMVCKVLSGLCKKPMINLGKQRQITAREQDRGNWFLDPKDLNPKCKITNW